MPDGAAEKMVFIVDDDDDVRESLAALLDVSGFVTATFATGGSFLSAMAACRRGCVLLDARLPDMNGLEVMSTLSEIGVRLPVVMITAYADVPLAVAAMRAGAADFLEKPYAEDVLLASVHAAMQREADEAAAIDDVRRINARLQELTPREREVLDRLLAGR
ncbi:MAG TPA: response regulator, partial [Rhodospirillales bacterium]|nr:response regulator [Rhodospirillales bacterium]